MSLKNTQLKKIDIKSEKSKIKSIKQLKRVLTLSLIVGVALIALNLFLPYALYPISSALPTAFTLDILHSIFIIGLASLGLFLISCIMYIIIWTFKNGLLAMFKSDIWIAVLVLMFFTIALPIPYPFGGIIFFVWIALLITVIVARLQKSRAQSK